MHPESADLRQIPLLSTAQKVSLLAQADSTLASFEYIRRLFNSLTTIYNSSTAQVSVNGTLTDSFDVSSGVKQGYVISPVLFSMYLNDLASSIKDLNCGVDINGTKLSTLLYADDIVI